MGEPESFLKQSDRRKFLQISFARYSKFLIPLFFIFVSGIVFMMGMKFQDSLDKNFGSNSKKDTSQVSVNNTPAPEVSSNFLRQLRKDLGASEGKWETYKNQDIGISFKYPSHWETAEYRAGYSTAMGESIVTLSFPYSDAYPEPNYPYFTLSYFDNPKNLSIKQFHEEYEKKGHYELGPALFYSDKDKEIIYPSGLRVRYGQFCGPTCLDFYVWKNNSKIFLFKANHDSSLVSLDLKIIMDKLLDKMVSTAEFL